MDEMTPAYLPRSKISAEIGFKASDQVRWQGIPRIQSGAYTKYVSISICGITPAYGLK